MSISRTGTILSRATLAIIATGLLSDSGPPGPGQIRCTAARLRPQRWLIRHASLRRRPRSRGAGFVGRACVHEFPRS